MLLDEFGLALGDVAERVGKAKSTVSNRVRLLELPEDVLGMLERGDLTERHARAVLAVPDHEGRRKLAQRSSSRGCPPAPPSAPPRTRREAQAAPEERGRPCSRRPCREAFARATGFEARVGTGQVVVGSGTSTSSRSSPRRSSA